MVQQQLNLFDFWLIIRRRRVIVLFAVVLVATLTVTVPYFFGPEAIYKSTSRVRYQRSTTVTGLLQERVAYYEGNDLETQAEVATSFPVMERVAKASGASTKRPRLNSFARRPSCSRSAMGSRNISKRSRKAP